MHDALNKFNYLKHLKSWNKKFFLSLKSESYIRIATLTCTKKTKALSVVCTIVGICATYRGLHFLRNWFKNKVPHHLALQT